MIHRNHVAFVSILLPALLCHFAGGPSAAGAQDLSRGPFLQRVTTSSVVVVWEQDLASSPEVRYGTASYDQVVVSPAAGRRHEVRLTGLEPGTAYRYAVFDGDRQLSSDLGFPTAVEPTVPFRFMVMGDTRSDPVAHQQVVDAMTLEEEVGFVVNSGDLVSTGAISGDWDEFFRIEQPLIGRTPIYPLIGNHDETDGDAVLYLEAFALPENAPQPEYYYSFEYGNSYFIVLDGHVQVEVGCLREGILVTDCFIDEQLEWLMGELRAAAMAPEIDNLFVFIHVGPYSSKEGRLGNSQMRHLLDAFLEYGVTAIFSGHDHYYERGLSGNGIPYVISGGGGAPLYEVIGPSPQPHTVIQNESTWHYVTVDVDGTSIRMTAKTPDGRVVDEVTLDSTPQCSVHTDCPTSGEACVEGTPRCTIGERCALDCPMDAVVDPPDLSPGGGGCSLGRGETPPYPTVACFALLLFLRRRGGPRAGGGRSAA